MDLLVDIGLLAAASLTTTFAAAGAHSWLTTRGRTLLAARQVPWVPIGQASKRATLRIVGTVRLSGNAIAAPLSGRPCCAYYATAVRKDAPTDRPSSFFNYVWPKEGGTNFVVDDGTGSVLVRCRSRVSMLWKDLPSLSDLPSDRANVFLRDSGVHGSSTDWIFREWTLQEGHVVAVVGVVAKESYVETHGTSSASGYRGSRLRCFNMRAPFGLNLLLSDHPEMTQRPADESSRAAPPALAPDGGPGFPPGWGPRG